VTKVLPIGELEANEETLMEAMITVRDSKKKVQLLKKDRRFGKGSGGKGKPSGGKSEKSRDAARQRIKEAKSRSTCNYCGTKGLGQEILVVRSTRSGRPTRKLGLRVLQCQ
jgi:hypothetical protein